MNHQQINTIKCAYIVVKRNVDSVIDIMYSSFNKCNIILFKNKVRFENPLQNK